MQYGWIRAPSQLDTGESRVSGAFRLARGRADGLGLTLDQTSGGHGKGCARLVSNRAITMVRVREQ